jgi:hypothetical protein
MKSSDRKYYKTDVADTEQILRLIQSIPFKKAEPFKLWLARLGRQKVDEIFDPSKGIDQMIDFYLKKGYSLAWIEERIKAIINRKKLTNVWQENGIQEGLEFAILTNSVYEAWADMNAQDYKDFKGIRKENLRDNMTDLEIALTTIGEIAARDIAKEERPFGLQENIKVAKRGGSVARAARDTYEKETKKSAISNKNNLSYKYVDETKQIDHK